MFLKPVLLSFLFIYSTAVPCRCGMWDLVPWPGIEPGPPALGVWSLNHRAAREAPIKKLLKHNFIFNFLAVLGLHCCTQALSRCGATFSLWRVGSSLQWLLLLRSIACRVRALQQLWYVGSVVVVHWLCYSGGCGIFLDQRSNLCPLLWQIDS